MLNPLAPFGARPGWAGVVALALWSCLAPVHAQQPAQFQLSGFASLVGGKVLGGADASDAPWRSCTAPCYVADWNHGGAYDAQLSLKPESRAGLQGTWVFNQSFSATAQVTARATDAAARLELAYLTYAWANWQLQVGRKRIPLYFYSDFQDVGIAYPWVSPPPDLYGSEATNYNGVSLRYRGSVSGIGVSASAFTGSEHLRDAPVYRRYETQAVDIDWTRLWGGDLELSQA